MLLLVAEEPLRVEYCCHRRRIHDTLAERARIGDKAYFGAHLFEDIDEDEDEGAGGQGSGGSKRKGKGRASSKGKGAQRKQNPE